MIKNLPPSDELTVGQLQKIIAKVQESDYGYMPGGQSLDYAASQMFKFAGYEDFPVKTLKPYLDDGYEYCYAVHLPFCKSQDMNKYFRWCFNTYGPAGFEIDTGGRRFYFREEKNRTMFLLKWGNRMAWE